MSKIFKTGVVLGMFLLISRLYSFAQVSITNDGSQPDSSAMLDVKSNNKGFLPPRVALSSINSSEPITAPAIGLLIYNTATSGTPPNNVMIGYYYWNGTRWNSLTLPQGTNTGNILYWNGTTWIPSMFYINVLSFGADNTGVQDATTAIQNALNAVPGRGGTVFFPAGKYRTTGGLTMSHNTTLLGENGNYSYDVGNDTIGSTIFCNSSTATLLTVNAPNCNFRNLIFFNKSALAPTAGTGITLSEAGGFKMQDCSIVGFWNDMEIANGEFWSITGTVFQKAINYGLKIASPSNPDMGDNSIIDCDFLADNNTVTGIRWESSGGLKIANCKFVSDVSYRFATCIDAFLHNSTGQLQVINNSFESFSGYGIHVHASSTSIRTGTIIISGNYFSPNASLTGNVINLTGYKWGTCTETPPHYCPISRLSQVNIAHNIFNTAVISGNGYTVKADSVDAITVKDNIFYTDPYYTKVRTVQLVECTAVDTLLNGTVTGTGTIGWIPKFTATSTMGNSPIYVWGTDAIGIGVNNDVGILKFGSGEQSIITTAAGKFGIQNWDGYGYANVFYANGNNVGINTTTASETFEVNGNTKAIGFLAAPSDTTGLGSTAHIGMMVYKLSDNHLYLCQGGTNPPIWLMIK